MPDFGFDGVSSSLAEFMYFSFFFSNFFSNFFNFFWCYVSNPDTTHNRQHTSSAGCVLQPAGYQRYTRLPRASRAGSNSTRVR